MNKLVVGIFIVLLAFIIGGSIYYLSYSPPSPPVQVPKTPENLEKAEDANLITTKNTDQPISTPPISAWSEEIIHSPLNQKTYENKESVVQHFKAKEGGYFVKNEIEEMQVNIALGVKSGGGGLIVDNNLPESDRISIRITYYPEYKEYFFIYKTDEKGPPVILEGLFGKPSPPVGRFSLKIDKEGKTVTVIRSDSESKSFQLNKSIYSKGRELHFKIETLPSSSIVVTQLSILEHSSN